MTSDGPMELLLAAFSLLMFWMLVAALARNRIRGKGVVYTRAATPVRYWVSVAGVGLCLLEGLFGMAGIAAHLF